MRLKHEVIHAYDKCKGCIEGCNNTGDLIDIFKSEMRAYLLSNHGNITRSSVCASAKRSSEECRSHLIVNEDVPATEAFGLLNKLNDLCNNSDSFWNDVINNSYQ